MPAFHRAPRFVDWRCVTLWLCPPLAIHGIRLYAYGDIQYADENPSATPLAETSTRAERTAHIAHLEKLRTLLQTNHLHCFAICSSITQKGAHHDLSTSPGVPVDTPLRSPQRRLCIGCRASGNPSPLSYNNTHPTTLNPHPGAKIC